MLACLSGAVTFIGALNLFFARLAAQFLRNRAIFSLTRFRPPIWAVLVRSSDARLALRAVVSTLRRARIFDFTRYAFECRVAAALTTVVYKIFAFCACRFQALWAITFANRFLDTTLFADPRLLHATFAFSAFYIGAFFFWRLARDATVLGTAAILLRQNSVAF